MPTYLTHDWFPQSLPPNVILGEQSWLYSAYAFLHYRSQRACGLRVGHNTGIYIDTLFDLGSSGEVEIGNYCTLAGPIITTNGYVKIGDYVLISREVVLADSFAAVPPTNSKHCTSDNIMIGNDVWIGTRAVILGGAHLGDGAIVGAGAVVDFEVPAYAIAAGNPAKIVGWAYPA